MPAHSSLTDSLADVVGPAHVLTDPAVTAAFTSDWTGRWHGAAATVVRPASTEEVAGVVRACADAGVIVVPQGGNTGLVGGAVPGDGDVVLSLRRLDRVERVDPVGHLIAAGAGVTVAAAHQAAGRHALALGVDLASRDSATLGGIVATNAGGIRVVRHGSTRAQVMGVEAVLADGSVLRRWSGLEKDNVGYDLPGLLTGSEGTLGVVTGVLMRLVTPPRHVQVLLMALAWLDAAVEALEAIRRTGTTVEAAEYFGQDGLELVCATSGLRLPFAEPAPYYLLVEVSGASHKGGDLSGDTSGDTAVELLDEVAGLVSDATIEAAPGRRLWAYREGHTEAVNATSTSAPVKLDVSVPVPSLSAFEATLRERLAAAFPTVALVTFGHIAEGNVHVNLMHGDPAAAEAYADLVYGLVAEHGGSISAEHGVGRAKLPWIGLSRSETDVAAMRAIKAALDPAGLLNPGVLLPPA